MAIPTDYTFSDGAYFKRSDGSGPYYIDGAGTATLMPYTTFSQAQKDAYTYAKGAYWRKSDNSGPYALTSA